ncbi:MAG: GntR family transcriptional regulator [Terrimicrobiaceae bacterium]
MSAASKNQPFDRRLSAPIYKQIAQWIEEQIHSGVYAPGAMLPSTKSFREQLGGVNHLTIRQAIAALSKKGLVYSVKGKGTYVARQSATEVRAARGVIGVVCSSLADGYAHQIVVGVESHLRKAGYELILCNSEYSVANEADHLRRLRARGVDGVLLFPFMPPANQELVESLANDRAHRMPIVCLDRGFPKSNLPLVDADNRRGAYEAVSHLISLGHRRIGFIVSSISWIETLEPLKQRFLGYRQALKEAGIEFHRELIQEVGSTLAFMRPRDVGLEHYGYQAMHKLLMLDAPPTAVFLLWDEIAPGALAAIRNSNLRVPQDVSLVGCNDELLAKLLARPLTTIHMPAEQIGAEAAHMLVDLLNGEPVKDFHKILPAKLLIRATTAAVAGRQPFSAPLDALVTD